jgi:hypothetical protein
MCRTVNLSVVLYGSETRSFTLAEGHGQRVLGKKGIEDDIWVSEIELIYQGNEGHCKLWSFMVFTPRQTLSRQSNQEERDGQGMWHVGGEAHTGFWWENVGERYYLEDLGIDEVIILKQI